MMDVFLHQLILSCADEHLREDVVDTRNIVVFTDCVLDMDNFEGGLRGGRGSDFMTTMIDYSLKEDDEYEKELQQLLDSMFPYESTKNYFLMHLSSCLDAGNYDKLFVIWYGNGNNGKSVMESIVESAFGGYCYKVPTSIFIT